MTCHYYKEKHPDTASEKTLVNPLEFNDRLPAHGSESKLQVSVTRYYIAKIKTTMKNTHCRHKQSQRLTCKHVIHKQMCFRCASLSWSPWGTRSYTTCAWISSRGLIDWQQSWALHPHLFISEGDKKRKTYARLVESLACVLKLCNGASLTHFTHLLDTHQDEKSGAVWMRV